MRFALLAACLVLALGWSEAFAEPPAPTLAGLRAQRAEMAAAFAAQAAACFTRHDTDNPVFRGCVDWHSSAHAAWALSFYQHATHDARYAPLIDAAFDPAAIAQEVAHLTAAPDFENPYGRAWFLRLAIERRAMGDHRLDALAATAADGIQALYTETPPDPTSAEYVNASWGLINLLFYARATHDTAREAFVVAQVRAHFLAPRCTLDLENHGFMSICVTWAWLVEEALPRREFRAWYARWNPGLETLTPVLAYPAAHDYGRNFSRAWGLYHLARALHDRRLRAAYVAHVAAGYDPPERWRGAYMVNGHWVAQFGMLAIAPLFGE